MKKALLLLILPICVLAQNPQEVWETDTYVDGSSVSIKRSRKDASGNMYSVGSAIGDVSGDYDIFVSKNDADGNVVFSDFYDSGLGNDQALEVRIDQSGNIYVVGNIRGGNAIFARKYSSTGTIEYTNIYSSAIVTSTAEAADIQNSTGNLYITGSKTNVVTGEEGNMLLIKYAADGSTDWEVDFDGGSGTSNKHDSGYQLQVDGSGNAYVLGVKNGLQQSSGFVSLGTPFLRAYNSAGTFIWNRVPAADGGDPETTLTMETNSNVAVYDWDRKQRYATSNGAYNETVYFEDTFLLYGYPTRYKKLSDGGYVRENNNWIKRYDSGGTLLSSINKSGSAPYSILMSGDETLYTVDGYGSIRKYDVSTSAISLAWTYNHYPFTRIQLTGNNTITAVSGGDSLTLVKLCIPPEIELTQIHPSGLNTLCAGDTLSLSVDAEYGDSYSWFGNGFGPNADTVYVGPNLFNNQTTYLSVEVDAGNGCMVTADFTPFLSFKYIDAFIVPYFEGDCEDDPGLLFSLIDANFYRYNWYFNGAQQTFEATSDTMLLTPGNGTYTMEVLDTQTGCLSMPSPTYDVTGIMPADDPSFSYSQAQYCGSDNNPTPAITGVVGGAFTSSPNGLVIDANSGEIDLSASAENTYSVQYRTNGACVDSLAQTVAVINCCGNPSTYSVSNIQSEEVTLSWNLIAAATKYKVKVRPVGGAWTYHTVLAPDTFKVKGNLTSGTNYEWKVKTLCASNSPAGYGPIQYFTTTAGLGCYNPTNLFSTDLMANNATMSWGAVPLAIEYKLKLRPVGEVSWTYITLSDTFKLKNGLTAATDYEWKVKTVCNANSPGSYGPLQYFSTSTLCENPTTLFTTDIMANNATMNWNAVPLAIEYQLKLRAVGTPSWTYITLTDTFKLKNGLTAATDYEWKVKTVCNANSPGSYGPLQYFITAAPPRLSNTADENDVAVDISVYPNPTDGQIHIDLGDKVATLTMNVYNPLGALVQTKQLQALRYLTHQLPAIKGIYLIQLVNAQGVIKTMRIANH
jgi:hypothetical protein